MITDTINIFGIRINAVTMPQALDIIDEHIKSAKSLHIGVVNAAKVVNMKRNPELAKDVTTSDVIFADGSSVVWASKVLKQPLPERVTGIDLMTGILDRGNENQYRVYCLGATEEISEKVEQFIHNNYPNVILAGRRNGYFKPEEEEQIAKNIAASKADVLFVAITSPKKENFMAKWNDTMKVPIVHGVGGSFDVVAGKVARAPVLWQKLGMEWLYRLLQEPGRLWKRYLVTNSWFIWLLFLEKLKQLRGKKTDESSNNST